MLHISGVLHKAADAMSRHSTGQNDRKQDDIATTTNVNTLPIKTLGHFLIAGIRCVEGEMGTSHYESLGSTAAAVINSSIVGESTTGRQQ